MFGSLFFLVFIISSPVFTAVYKENLCTVDEHRCDDGTCVGLRQLCDGRKDCWDGSDEEICQGWVNPLRKTDGTLNRSKRQSSCRTDQWQCAEGTCIGFDGKCDGVVDCPDGSDETFPLCRKSQCQSNWFRCTYGACVDGNAPCNGIKDCADDSDELLPRCRNETDEIRGEFTCLDGQKITADKHCDGVVDCPDGSDETVSACAGKTCPSYLFQCAYGACVDQGSDCNGIKECADGSDESDELCNRTSTVTTTSTIRPVVGGKCVLPAYPQHGKYTVGGSSFAKPGLTLNNAFINITCDPGFAVENQRNTLQCHNGIWSDDMPKCVRFCRLSRHPSVEYRCIITGPNDVEGTRECGPFEPSGTTVKPQCRAPNYYSSGPIYFMHCDDGSWNYIARCKPECGTETPDGIQLVIGGQYAERGELPWHAGIYDKYTTPYMQVCGGSLISTTTIISAAHCFWSDAAKKQPASRYAVALGKRYRPWNNPKDKDAQKSEVEDIKIPTRFGGQSANFQDDIALVIVTTPFTYQVFIRPVCVDFDINFDRQQLTEGNMGKAAGWGLTTKDGIPSQILKVVNLPYVEIKECIRRSPPGFREYITSDKICAGWTNGTTLCQGDSGGGLVFPSLERGTLRYYLRGIVSSAPRNADLCNAHALTAFTQLTKHEHFIREFVNYIEPLHVTRPPSPSTVLLDQGATLTLECEAKGTPTPLISWRRDQGHVPPQCTGSSVQGRGVLTCPDMQAEHSGAYSCEAINNEFTVFATPDSIVHVKSTRNKTGSVNHGYFNRFKPPHFSCKSHEVNCGNGPCIPESSVCNGRFDCSDGSDEESCNSNRICEPDEYQCANRKCIFMTWFCDSEDDCGDGSDEQHCLTEPDQQCKSYEFMCASYHCIPKYFHCDGFADCLDSSDEMGCKPVHVTLPPSPSAVRLQAGDTLKLMCAAEGTPTPLISWRRNWGHPPPQCTDFNFRGRSILICPDMLAEHSGAYSCEATNNRGTVYAKSHSIVQVVSIGG